MNVSEHDPVHQRMAALHESLAVERPLGEIWQSAREGHLFRERSSLLARVAALRADHSLDPVARQREIRRLTLDLDHHRQRVNDLVYDSVSMDLGGSE